MSRKTESQKTASQSEGSSPMLDPNQIRERAYAIFRDRHTRKTHGTAESDWLQAESELKKHQRPTN